MLWCGLESRALEEFTIFLLLAQFRTNVCWKWKIERLKYKITIQNIAKWISYLLLRVFFFALSFRVTLSNPVTCFEFFVICIQMAYSHMKWQRRCVFLLSTSQIICHILFFLSCPFMRLEIRFDADFTSILFCQCAHIVNMYHLRTTLYSTHLLLHSHSL